MKKIMLLTMLTIALAAGANAQPTNGNQATSLTDSTAKKDTVEKIVYSYQYVDTVKRATLMYKGENGAVRWCSPGYLLQTGFVTKDKATGKLTWLTQPQVIGALDDRKRPVKPIL